MILLAPDKFKGTMSAREVADAMSRGLRRAGVSDDVVFLPMADGGEGTPEAFDAEPVSGVSGAYRLSDDAVLVMSCSLAGANLLSLSPEMRSSALVGEAVMRLAPRFRDIYIGIGGTSSADAGAGFLYSLGWTFVDSSGRRIDEGPTPAVLARRGLSEVIPSGVDGPGLVGLCDVACPMLPCDGLSSLSAMDFVRQKGFVSHSQRAVVANAFAVVASCVASSLPAFGGAGGGLGYAVGAVPGSKCRLGAEAVIDFHYGLFEGARLVITGEGSIDEQTAGGKCVDSIFRYCCRRSVPVLAVGGRVTDATRYPMTIACQAADAPLPDKRTAMNLVSDAVAEWASENLVFCK